MSKANQCDIYDQIDGLDEARTVAELVTKLKPILNRLAYVAVTGEGSVMDSHETWHDNFTDALYSAASSDHREGQLSNVMLPSAPAPVPKATKPRKHAEKPIADHDPRLRTASTHGRNPVQQAPPARPAASSIPPSLLAIMEGRHPSLREPDD